MTEEKLLNMKEVAQILRVNYITVLRMVRDGNIYAKKLRGVYRFKREWIDNLFIHHDTTGLSQQVN